MNQTELSALADYVGGLAAEYESTGHPRCLADAGKALFDAIDGGAFDAPEFIRLKHRLRDIRDGRTPLEGWRVYARVGIQWVIENATSIGLSLPRAPSEPNERLQVGGVTYEVRPSGAELDRRNRAEIHAGLVALAAVLRGRATVLAANEERARRLRMFDHAKRSRVKESQSGRPGVPAGSGAIHASEGPGAAASGDIWALRPFDSNCTERVAIDSATISAVRRVIGDWDGTNWAAVEAVLQRAGLLRPLAELTVFDVRMQFAVGQRDLTVKLGRELRTTDATIVTAKFEPAVGSPGVGAATPDAVWNALTDRQRGSLIALRELGAFDADRRQRTEDIAKHAEGPAVDPAGFKEPLAELVTRGLLESKRGAGGGYWLSANGVAVLSTVRPEQARRSGSA